MIDPQSKNWAHGALLLMDEVDALIRFGCANAPAEKYETAAKAFWRVSHMLAAERARLEQAPAEAGHPVAFREVAADGTPITDWIDGGLPPNTPPLHPGATIQFAYGKPAAKPIAWESTTLGYTKFITDEKYRKLRPTFQAWYKPYRCSQCSAPAAAAFPDALMPELSYVLGMPNFRCAPYAAIFREAGHDIPCKAEAEQAFVIHRMVRAVLQHGAGWDAAFVADLRAAADSAKAALAEKGGAS